MNSRDLINALEDIIETERELREQIDKLNVAIRCNAIISSMGSDELKRQELIVDNIEIGEFDGSFKSDLLSPEELAKRKQAREALDFSISPNIETEKLSKEELARRQKERSKNDYSIRDDFKSDKLSPEELAKREKERVNISLDKDDFESQQLSKEELAKREADRDKLDFSIRDDFKSMQLSPDELKKRESERESANDIFDSKEGFETEQLTPEELRIRAEEREKLKKSLGSLGEEAPVIEITNKKIFPKLGKHKDKQEEADEN